MKLQVLGSSSKGNCYFLTSGNETLIIEAGLKWKTIQQALSFDLSNVVGCLISHEHKDHSKAVQDVMKSGIDIYCTEGTAQAIGVTGHRIKPIKHLQQFKAGQFVVLPFPTQHDASEPCGFLIVSPKGEKLLFATDTFYIENRFTGINYFMVESNYCKDILCQNIEAGLIPAGMRDRLLQSHFELENVKRFLQANVSAETRMIVLLHLSDGNSNAERMVREITELTGIETAVAEPGEIELDLFPF